MNGTFRIEGGVPLHGEVTPIANKNALMGALPAAALPGAGILFRALPDTLDVHTYLEILTRLGAKVTASGHCDVHVDPTGIRAPTIDPAMGRRLRGAFSLTGPLLARFGSVEMPLPGGCDLGFRGVTTHLDGFRKLDVAVEQRESSVLLTAPRSHADHYDIWLVEASVSATLDLALYAAGSGFSVTIRDAACEPHVIDVLRLLRRMGAKVEGEGTNRLTIRGPGRPLAGAEFEAGPDYVDLAGSVVATAVTGGRLTILGGNVPTLVNGMANWFRAFGIELEQSGDDLLVAAPERLQVHSEFLPQAGRDPAEAGGATVARLSRRRAAGDGDAGVQEPRRDPVPELDVRVRASDYVRELNYLGAEILISDPQRVMVREPAITFRGGEIAAPYIIQGTKAIFLAALADDAETVIHGVDLLRRRYPTIFETYSALGARIEYEGPARAVQAGA